MARVQKVKRPSLSVSMLLLLCGGIASAGWNLIIRVDYVLAARLARQSPALMKCDLNFGLHIPNVSNSPVAKSL